MILLTAKSELSDIVTGLDAGSDDYLPKPFSTAELLARIRALGRRSPRYTENVLQFKDLVLNQGGMELSCGKKMPPAAEHGLRRRTTRNMWRRGPTRRKILCHC